MINLKDLNRFITCKHLKMEGLHLLKENLEPGNYLYKLDLKDAYFCVPLNKQSRKYVLFEWRGSMYEFLCLYFGPDLRLFTKLMKVSVAILRKLCIRIIVYLNNFLILGKTLEEAILSRDAVIYLLQNLGSVLHPTQRRKFLVMIIDSVEMTVSMPQEKVESNPKGVRIYCQCRRCQ